MARISGVNLEDNWKVNWALTKIKGIGWSLSKQILAVLKIDPTKRVVDLTAEEIAKLSKKIEEYPTEGEWARQVKGAINRLKTAGTYRGARHAGGLPVRGQRTKSNARTKRGKRKTVGAFKKEQLAKMGQQKKQKTREEGKSE
jgi:small subunit ribosomal protein S13